jgi:DNA invertase Pin-like site-specific DNA recombinase
MGMIYGYARVSTNSQSLASQRSALEAAGAEKVFTEKVSGAQTKRRQLEACLRQLKPEDTLIVTRLDRLARSTRDLLNIVERVSEAGAQFRSLADA